MSRILIFDAPSDSLEAAAYLRADGHTALVAHGLQSAREALLATSFDVVLTSDDLTDSPGGDVVNLATAIDSSLSVVLMSARAGIAADQGGQFETVSGEYQPERIRSAVRRANKRTELIRENLLLKASLQVPEDSCVLQGNSAAVRALRGRIAQVGGSKVPLLITGESGVGKHAVAHAISGSAASGTSQPLPRLAGRRLLDLLERGADATDCALLHAISDGLLLLDDLASISHDAEFSLRQLLQTGLVPLRGSSERLAVHARILLIARTSRQREDDSFLSRTASLEGIDVVRMHVPALRERLEDLPALCAHISGHTASELRVPQRMISVAAITKLSGYHFPGNLRELRNLVERAYIMSDNPELQPSDFALPQVQSSAVDTPLQIAEPDAEGSFDLLGYLQRLEEEIIRRALDAAGGAQAEAARRMGISRSLLAYKLNKYGIRPAEGARGPVRDSTSS